MATINGYEFTIGADPEIFVKKRGVVASAYGLIPGTKKFPLKVRKGAVQVDGMALEFNIDPAGNEKAFRDNINEVMAQLKVMTPGYDFDINPVAEFGAAMIAAQPKEARILGCDPDFNAWTRAPNPAPNAKADFRTASGHVHIGWKKKGDKNWPDNLDVNDESHLEACRALTKTLDAYLGIPSIAWDENAKRRELYGKAGAFRPKPYGMEYRTLSNAWLNKPHLISLVYNNTLHAIKALFEDEKIADKVYFGLSAQEIINAGDVQTVAKVLRSGVIKSPRYYREIEEQKVA